MGYPTVCELARFKIFERSEVCSEGWWFGGPSLNKTGVKSRVDNIFDRTQLKVDLGWSMVSCNDCEEKTPNIRRYTYTVRLCLIKRGCQNGEIMLDGSEQIAQANVIFSGCHQDRIGQGRTIALCNEKRVCM